MTDDSTTGHITIQKATALATAEMATAQQSTTPDVLPTKTDLPPKLVEATATCTRIQKGKPQEHDGTWQQLTFHNMKGIDAKGMEIWGQDYHLTNVYLNEYMGIPWVDFASDSTNKVYQATYSGDNLKTFFYFKPLNLEATFKDFCLYIERDGTGGIQLVDDIVWQVRKMYMKWNTLSTEEYGDTIEMTKSDLNKGLKVTQPIKCVGWLPRSELFATTKNNTTNKDVYVYQQLYSLIANIGGNKPYRLYLPEPPYCWFIRALNLPTTSNTKYYLSFTTTIVGTWLAKGKPQSNIITGVLPYAGQPKTTQDKIEHEKHDKEDETNKKKVKRLEATVNKLVDKLTASRYINKADFD